jgi:cytochrome c556
MKSLIVGTARCVLVTVALAASAQTPPADAIALRQSQFRDLGAAMKNVTDELKSSAPVKFVLKISAKQIVAHANAQFSWFPPGSGLQAGVKTRAKDAIWADPEGFKKAQLSFQTEANHFLDSLNAGDAATIRAAHKALGEACASCHKQFREPED